MATIKHHNGRRRPKRQQVTACRVCGCTNVNACWHHAAGPCFWIEPDLCSHCVAIRTGEMNREDVERPADRIL